MNTCLDKFRKFSHGDTVITEKCLNPGPVITVSP